MNEGLNGGRVGMEALLSIFKYFLEKDSEKAAKNLRKINE